MELKLRFTIRLLLLFLCPILFFLSLSESFILKDHLPLIFHREDGDHMRQEVLSSSLIEIFPARPATK